MSVIDFEAIRQELEQQDIHLEEWKRDIEESREFPTDPSLEDLRYFTEFANRPYNRIEPRSTPSNIRFYKPNPTVLYSIKLVNQDEFDAFI